VNGTLKAIEVEFLFVFGDFDHFVVLVAADITDFRHGLILL